MDNRHDIQRVDADSPDRCQAVTGQGQCLNKAVSGGTHCIVHGGNKQLQSQKAQGVRNYRLTKWRAKLEQQATSPSIKSLRDEIGILRILMEERLEKCQDENELLMQSGPISDLVLKIDKVVTSCHKLEGSMGQLLDKAALIQFASRIIEVIGEVLEGQDDNLNIIADRILEIMSEGEETHEN